jgi:glycosyltransferase involved in cell wall biosynthesis
MTKFYFSVILPIHNGINSSQLSLCIDSLLLQTLIPTEIIIIFDGYVNDDIESVINNKLSNISFPYKILKNKINRGPGYSRNLAIKFSTYNIVAFMDADDYSVPNRFELQIPLVSNNLYDIVGGQIAEFYDNIDDIISIRRVPLNSFKIKKQLKRYSSMNNVTVAIKKDILLKHGGFPEIYYGEDYLLWIKLAEFNYKFYNFNEILVKVRTDKNFLTRRFSKQQLKNNFILFNNLVKFESIGFLFPTLRLISFLFLFYLPDNIRKFIFLKIIRNGY